MRGVSASVRYGVNLGADTRQLSFLNYTITVVLDHGTGLSNVGTYPGSHADP